MEIRQLRYFVNAAKTLSFTEAARLSNVAQSTLSQQVKQLETELGVPLFHRMGKRIQLTTEGQTFLADAQRLLDDARQGLQRLSDMKELQGGSLSIGLASGLGLSALLTDVLTEYNKRYPKVVLTIHQVAAPLLPDKIRKHELDLAMTFTPQELDADLHVEPLFATRICAIVSEHHSLESRQSVNLDEVLRHPLVLPSRDLLIRRRMDAAARLQGLELLPQVEIDDLSHIMYMVRSGRWVSMLPDAATLAVRGLVHIPIKPVIPLPTSVLTLSDTYQRKAVTEFLRLLGESARLLLQTSNETCDICGEAFLAK
ncbi:MAG: LysR family transcriptional regulator [Prevotella sp.]|jgi:LysR family cyn operon transcriptional activator